MSASANVELVLNGATDMLEMNLLHLCWGVRFDPIRLNKGGAPNRRSLLRHARGLALPGTRREVGEDVDLGDAEQIDYIAFTLAIAIELGVLCVSDGGELLRSVPEKMNQFFDAKESIRTRRLVDALGRLRLWNELSSHAFLEPRNQDDEHLSLLVATGERLIGARGAMFSALKRLDETGWISVERFAHEGQDRADDYLVRALEDEVAIFGFAHAIARRALVWSGFADVGRDEAGKAYFRLTERGRMAFHGEREEPRFAPPQPCLIVQPNLEITVMLEPAGLDVLHGLYRISERRSLADRVATFALSARTVQRGYANGASAENVTRLLSERGMTPLPDSIKFQLEDWERVHRRVAVYADGILFRHADPDQLDLVVGQLSHENPDVEFVRLGPSTTYAASTALEGLDRFFRRDEALEIDYLGVVPPCLEFVGPLEFAYSPMLADIVTAASVDAITEEVSASRTERRCRIDAERARAHFPEATFDRVIEFLEPRVVGGLPAAQYLRLRALLDSPTRATILHGLTVLMIDSTEDGDRLAQSAEFEQFVDRRLGPRAFAVYTELERELLDFLHDIGVRGGSFDG